MTPMTPSGVATRSITSPFGRSNRARMRPTGSARAAMSSSPLAMASTHGLSSAKRSRKALAVPFALAAAMSRSLAARMSGARVRIVPAASRIARFFVPAEASESACAALRAACPIAAMTSAVLASRVASSTGLRFPMRLRLPSGNLVARKDHVVPVDDHRAPWRAEQIWNILRIAPGDQDRIARVIGDETAPDLGAAKIADQDAIAAGKVPLDPGHAGGQ